MFLGSNRENIYSYLLLNLKTAYYSKAKFIRWLLKSLFELSFIIVFVKSFIGVLLLFKTIWNIIGYSVANRNAMIHAAAFIPANTG